MADDAKPAEVEAPKTEVDRAAQLTADADAVLAEVNADLIVSATAQHEAPKPHGAWRVLRQCSYLPDEVVCAHRFELIADLCSVRKANRGSRETGVFYTVRRAES